MTKVAEPLVSLVILVLLALMRRRVRNYYYDDYNGLRDIGKGYKVDTRCAGLNFEFVLDRHGVEECGTSDRQHRSLPAGDGKIIFPPKGTASKYSHIAFDGTELADFDTSRSLAS